MPDDQLKTFAGPRFSPGDLGHLPTKLPPAEDRIASRSLRHLAVGKVAPPPAAGVLPKSLLEKVIGKDDRRAIFETEHAPWRMICALRISMGGKSYIGTGWLAGPKTVVTCGHNLFDGRWARKVEVTPGLDRDERPYGSQTSRSFEVLKGWRLSQDPEHDMGVIHLEHAFAPAPGHFAFGAFGDDALLGMGINVAGYPGEVEIPDVRDPWGDTLYHHANRVCGVTATRIYYDVDTSPGNSGSPAWVHTDDMSPPIAAGVHAYGFGPNQPGHGAHSNSSPRITDYRYDIIKGWVDADNGRPEAASRPEEAVSNGDDTLPPARPIGADSGIDNGLGGPMPGGSVLPVLPPPPMQPAPQATPLQAGKPNAATIAGWLAAAAVLVVYFVFAFDLYEVAGKEDIADGAYDRKLALFTQIEAFAMAGAGLLFGVTLQKGQTRKAEAQAQSATDAQKASEERLAMVRSWAATASRELERTDTPASPQEARTALAITRWIERA